MNNNRSRKLKRKRTGDLSEYYAVLFLVKQGFTLVFSNYVHKGGEIDLVLEKGGILHFVDVDNVSRETISLYKMRKMKRISKAFLKEYCLEEKPFQIDLITVENWVGENVPEINYIPKVNL